MAEKVIKHKWFTFQVPVLDENGEPVMKTTKHGQERPKMRRVHARRHQRVDIPLEDEVARGEALGAFFTEEELAAAEAAASESPPATQPSGVPEDLNFDDNDMLVNWLKTAKPNATVVVAAAGDDPDKAIALMDAEEEATGGQPRKTVMEPLQKIAEG